MRDGLQDTTGPGTMNRAGERCDVHDDDRSRASMIKRILKEWLREQGYLPKVRNDARCRFSG